jgi:DNA polymerase-3 subunit chi
MAKVDFYVLSEHGEPARQRFACRLAEKAYKLQNRVHICVGQPDSGRTLDDLLWTFRDGSFVPHELLDEAPGEPEAPVTIGSGSLPEFDCDLLINLGDNLPGDAGRFPRIAEVVSADDECRTRSRQRFVDYRAEGHTLDTHKL